MSLSAVAVRVLVGAVFVIPVASQAPTTPRVVTVEAERFSFTPSRIKLAVGEEIEIHLRSADTAHGFRVAGTDIDIEIPKRGKGDVVVRFSGSSVGRFTFECNRMCGAGHHFMRGELVVEAKDQ